MIKINVGKETLIFKDLMLKTLNNKEIALYIFLLAKQQEGIYYQTIKEIAKEHKKAYKTISKYLNNLIDKGFIYKYKEIYIINYTPQKRIK